jgi:hypothetical protein
MYVLASHQKIKDMNSKLVTTINNQGIFSVIDEFGIEYLPIKPICTALGINYKAQFDKIKEDPILLKKYKLIKALSADNKKYKMLCLPVKYVLGWLFTICEKNIKEDAREELIKYKNICYLDICNHITKN